MNKTLMTHLYYGDPHEAFSLRLVKTLVDNGADILEVGIPYSDPVCDGEVFQRACLRALDGGMTPPKVFEGIKKIRAEGTQTPIYITSYFGPIFKYGVKAFVKEVKEVGASGLIIPDILFEEQKELLSIVEKEGIAIVQFATPYSTEERIEQIASAAQGFLYCVSVPGVTGTRDEVEKQTTEMLQRVKRTLLKVKKDIPVFVGFGISKPIHVKTMLQAGADGVIVGSAIGRIYEQNLTTPKKTLPEIAEFIRSLKSASSILE